MRTRYKIIGKENSYFITSTIVEWIPVFASEKYYNILIDTIKFYQSKNGLEIFAFVLLPEHFHMLIKCKDLVKTVQLIKMYSAKKIIDELKADKNYKLLDKFKSLKKDYKVNSEYQIWQEGFHPQMILSESMYFQKMEYIHFNPLKKGLVTEITEWKYSSAGFYYEGKESMIEINV